VILAAASAIYAAAAAGRRRWYGRDPSRQRRLANPVISVGNLSTGGAGKTPIVEHLARLLVGWGERPAILSRGYGRPDAPDGVTVVSDASGVNASFATAGDEPLMLAQSLPGVPVLVAADRYLCGRLAETRLGATVHLLDDGFQHLPLARDVDLLAMLPEDLTDRVLPAGRLREPLASARAADAVLVPDDEGNTAAADRLIDALNPRAVFRVKRRTGAPRHVANGEPAAIAPGEPVFAFAGLARPERFFESVAAAGWRVAGRMAFRDHHVYTAGDLQRIAAAAAAAGARTALTTAKDAVRLAGRPIGPLVVACLPLHADIEPPDAFAGWLAARLAEARARRTAAGA
jgi:tetraacyldisaccharide 4'-kinase